MNDVLLKVVPADFARLISRRLKAIVPIALLCAVIATAIIVVEYRLMLIAFMVLLPAFIGVLDVVLVARCAKMLGPCEVRLDGDCLALNSKTRVKLDAITAVRVQPDALILMENRHGHLLPAEGAAREPLLSALRAHGRTMHVEQNTVAQLAAFLWGAMANLVLGKVAAVLVLAFIVYTVKGFTEGPGPGWEAAACLGGAFIAVLAKVLIHRFALSPSARG